MAKMRVIIKRPDEQYGHVTHISSRLGNLQNTVGGNIETVFLNDDLVVICNEEGKLLNLPYNMKLMGDVIVGTIIVCSVDDDGSLYGWGEVLDYLSIPWRDPEHWYLKSDIQGQRTVFDYLTDDGTLIEVEE